MYTANNLSCLKNTTRQDNLVNMTSKSSNSKSQVKSDSAAAPTIVWFRQDLRLADNPALHQAAERGGAVIPIFIWAPEEEKPWSPGGASKVWLHFSLKALAQDLESIGSRLLIFEHADSLEVLQELCQKTGADSVYWNRRYEPNVIERDKKIKASLKESGLDVQTFNGSLLIEPWEILTKESKPYQVFTPFWRACQMRLQGELHQNPPLPRPKKLPFDERLLSSPTHGKNHAEKSKKSQTVESVDLDSLALLPTIHWDTGIRKSWTIGEKGALNQLYKFMQKPMVDYKEGRDKPELEGVSRMSPHLHFGEISPRTIWHLVQAQVAETKHQPKLKEAAQSYLRELGWREFSHHLLYHFPRTCEEPLRPAFKHFPWAKNKKGYKAWTKGLTGYPIVDAGMRELWHTGIMHNRVRMIAASFLIKDLLIPWQDGANWFWDTLIDADLAQNTLGWQWTAGCGADAAPYFRIFNPILQGEKFDPDGNYVRRWVPELAKIKDKWIHKPWMAPPLELAAAGVTLGEDYPSPIVDHSTARDRALSAFQELKAKV